MRTGLSKKITKLRMTTWDEILFVFIIYVIIILFAFMCIYPLYFTIIASFSDAAMVYTGQVNLLPSGFTTDAYTLVFQNRDIWNGYANSIFYTVFGTLLNLFLTIPTAYALSRKMMFGRNIFTSLFIFTMYFGGGLIPTYVLMSSLGLINTRWILIINGGLSVYNIIVSRTFFQSSIPESLHEASRIDGASEFGIFFSIVLPLSMPIIAVMTLYYAVGHWGSYFAGMIYLTDSSLQPLQVVLQRILIKNEAAYSDALTMDLDAKVLADSAYKAYMAKTMKYALVFISSLPMLIAYPFVQKHFVKGVMIGALKG